MQLIHHSVLLLKTRSGESCWTYKCWGAALAHLLCPFQSQEGREKSMPTDSKSMGWGVKRTKSQ